MKIGLAETGRGEVRQPCASNKQLSQRTAGQKPISTLDSILHHCPQHTSTHPRQASVPQYTSLINFFIIGVAMAPHARAKRRRNNTSTLHPSVAAASDDVRLLSNGESLHGNYESKRIGYAADEPQSEETEAPTPQLYAMVEGEQMLVPQTYDPDTYDPDGRRPWTPEPEPYSPEIYSAWGRKHFGEEWYQLRKTMLEERNIYLQYDSVYVERQKALRIMEHKIERRPFEPRSGVFNESWKRLWARLSKELGIEIPASPTPSRDNDDNDTDLSGYSTYDPTPEPREPTPIPDDPWEELEFNRRRFH